MVGMFQDLQGMPETVISSEPYVYYVFYLYTYIPMVKFDLSIQHSQRLTTVIK